MLFLLFNDPNDLCIHDLPTSIHCEQCELIMCALEAGMEAGHSSNPELN